MEKKTFESEGIVLGNYWGGGSGAYKARNYSASTLEELLKLNIEALRDGSLDSGMGYESLKGAILTITETETRVIDGRDFTHTEDTIHFIGDLDEKEQDFLLESQLSM